MNELVKARVPSSIKDDVDILKKERMCSEADIVRKALREWLPKQPELRKEVSA